jgi:outer membrane protein assembly factor BamB
MRVLCAAVLLVAFSQALTPAAPEPPAWPQLLGPGRNGMSAETGLNFDWKKTPPKVVWQVEGGSGLSSLAVTEGKVVTACERNKVGGVLCLDAATGKEIWFREVGPAYIDKQRQGRGPRATPTVAGGIVYAMMATGEVAALKLADGAEVWKVNVVTLAGVKDRSGEQFYWGQSASPLVEGDLVIVQPGGPRGNSIYALDRKNGKVAWKLGDDAMGYASPIAIDLGKRRVLIVPTGQAVVGIDPVKGEQLFRYPFGNQFDATASTPLWTGELLLLSAAYGAGTAAVELSEDNGKIQAKEKWKSRDLMSLMAPLIVRDGTLVAFHGDLSRFGLRCLDLETGKLLWMQNYPGRLCFIWAEGHLLAVTEQGTVQSIKLGKTGVSVEGEVPDLFKGRVWAMPALAGKRLYLRDDRTIVCLDLAGR